mmetsp:Transcript_17615/g.54642  ORF Transcript_17615/g.54642 Transcript_17615/m.54642 type:complete len:235 (-) Transcript_17615:81-785(-)
MSSSRLTSSGAYTADFMRATHSYECFSLRTARLAIVVIVLRPRKRGDNESATRHIAREYPGATLQNSFSQTCLRRPAPRNQNVPSVRRRVLARGIAAHPVAPTLQTPGMFSCAGNGRRSSRTTANGEAASGALDPRQHASDEDEGPAIQCSTHVICRREKTPKTAKKNRHVQVLELYGDFFSTLYSTNRRVRCCGGRFLCAQSTSSRLARANRKKTKAIKKHTRPVQREKNDTS